MTEDKHIKPLHEKANVFPRIEELRRVLANPDIAEGDEFLEYLLTTIEYQQREIKALEKRMNTPRREPALGRQTRPGVLVK